MTRASVVVTNYQYGRFVADAIDSALAQTHPDTEVIVVDDGSTDGSREVIGAYGDSIVPLFKQNGGHGSAFNAGFERATGDVVVFLDADDMLLVDTVAQSVALLGDPDVAKVHWPMWTVDAAGSRTGGMKEPVLPRGDLRELVRREGPMTERALPSAPTSGNAYPRRFLERVLPMPPGEYRMSSDAYLFGLAPAFGRIETLPEPGGLWRWHGANTHKTTPFDAKVQQGVADRRRQCEVLARLLSDDGADVQAVAWRGNGWWERIDESLAEIAALPGDACVALADDAVWGADERVRGVRLKPFPDEDGLYGGPPADDAGAIAAVDAARRGGARHLVFAWPAFWWLDHYAGLRAYLDDHHARVLSNDRLVAWELEAP